MTTELVGYDLRLPKPLLEKISHEAHLLDLSINNHILNILESHLLDPQQLQDRIDALEKQTQYRNLEITHLQKQITSLQANIKYHHTT